MVEILIGLLGGILVGATGAGVGSFVTPLLILAGYRPGVAIGTGAGVLVAGKVFGSFTHHRMGHWPGGSAWVLLAGGGSGAVLAWWIARTCLSYQSAGRDVWLTRTMAVALLGAAAGLIIRQNITAQIRGKTRERNPAALFLVGLGVGTPVTLTSAGSGSLLSPALLMVTDWEVSQVAAASNFFGGAVGALSVVVHAGLGTLDVAAFAKVLLGFLPGVAAGTLLSRRIERRWFDYSISAVSIALAGRLLLR